LSQKKKILILIDWYLPGTKAGGPVRSIHALVMHLRSEFDFYILTTDTDLGENKPYNGIQPGTWIEKDGYHVKYLPAKEINKKMLEEEIVKPEYHRIYINSLYSKWFSIVALQIARKNKIVHKVILAPRGMLGKGAMAIKSIKKRAFLRIAKTLGWFNKVVWHATGEHEKNDILTRIGKNAAITLAPNLSWMRVIDSVIKKKEPGKLRLFYLSRIARVKNLHIALTALKEIPEGNEIVYHIYGPMEDKIYWEECQRIILSLPSHISVSYQGTIDHEKIAEVLYDYHALFLPTSNENFGHAIIESLACGCPVLISDQTPWRDLALKKAGADVALDKKDLFKNYILDWTACNDVAWNKWCEGSLLMAKQFLQNESAIDQYKELFK
jgi:glycosyltransferase involved in cell wall biosynthesis